MSAGFKVADDMFWGSNGSIEAYVDALAVQAIAQFGPGEPLAAFLQRERAGFYNGKVMFLDEWLEDNTSRGRFLEILDAATNQVLSQAGFTELGREWVESVMVGQLRAKVRPLLLIAPSILAWNNGCVPKLATAIEADRAFDRLPILADALEDAGCTHQELLDHCRGPGSHVSGCWVIDLLLRSDHV